MTHTKIAAELEERKRKEIPLRPAPEPEVVQIDRERKEFQSAGPNPNDKAGDENGKRLAGGKPQYLGTPDTGRFSHPKDPVQKDGHR